MSANRLQALADPVNKYVILYSRLLSVRDSAAGGPNRNPK